MQDQPLQAGLQVRRAHAALLGHAQRAETFRRRRPERAQGRLVAGEEGQARTRGQSSAEHRPLQGAKTVGARQGGGVPVFQGAFGGQAVERAEQAFQDMADSSVECVGTGILPRVPALNNGALHPATMSYKHHAPVTGVTPRLPSLSLHNKAERPQPAAPAQGGPGMTQTAITANPSPDAA